MPKAKQGAAAETVPDAAGEYVRRGWAVLPVRADAKVPLTAHGVLDASPDARGLTFPRERANWRRELEPTEEGVVEVHR